MKLLLVLSLKAAVEILSLVDATVLVISSWLVAPHRPLLHPVGGVAYSLWPAMSKQFWKFHEPDVLTKETVRCMSLSFCFCSSVSV